MYDLLLSQKMIEKDHRAPYHSFSLMERNIEASRAQSSAQNNGQSIIALYRRHIARAIHEERWASAEIFVDRILDEYPENTEALLLKAWIKHYCRKDEANAIHYYRKVVDVFGESSDHPHVQRAMQSMERLLAAVS
jgi:thiaminase